MGCAKYGGGICVVGLIISDGIVQEVDLTPTYSISFGRKQDNHMKITELKQDRFHKPTS